VGNLCDHIGTRTSTNLISRRSSHAGARHFRRRAARPRRPQWRGDPAAADLHDGPDLGHRDAVLHLLVARCSAAPSPQSCSTFPAKLGRSRPPSTVIRWRSRQGGGSADCGLHLILHRFAGRGAADHVPGADDLVVRAEIRTTGILFGVSAHLLLLVGLGLGREAKHKTVISMSLGVLLAGRRHGHGVWPASHDLRFD